MSKFEIIGKGKESGRRRKRIYSAPDENTARCLADEDGTLVQSIIELPPEPPTDRQIKYAKDLGILIPPNVTFADLSDLISFKQNNDKPATERHKQFARNYNIQTTDYIGKKSLFNMIQSTLSIPGREKELLSWFVFRVYRRLVRGASDAPIQGPDHTIIQEISEQLVVNEKIIQSIRRYEGKELIWFGEWIAPDGSVLTGGSNRTAAYKEAAALLKKKANFPVKQPTPSPKLKHRPAHQSTTNLDKPKGCLSVIALALLIPPGIIATVSLIGEITA